MNVEEPIPPIQITSSSSGRMALAEDSSIMNKTTVAHRRQDQSNIFLSMPLWGGKKVDDDEISLFDDIHTQFSAINLIDDTIAEVQKVDKESKMRAEMRKLLEMCLRAQDNKCDMKPSQSKESIRKLASMLEHRLYKSAISFESYCDLQTLQSRMRVVLYHLRNQRETKRRKLISKTAQKRSQLLKQKLGLSQYARAEWLVHEIRQRKNLLAGQSCSKCLAVNNRSSSSCPPPSSSSTAPFREHLPTPVRDLFFRTPFVDIFAKYPLERIDTLSWQQLQQMMDQAERHMEEFDSWKMVNEVVCSL